MIMTAKSIYRSAAAAVLLVFAAGCGDIVQAPATARYLIHGKVVDGAGNALEGVEISEFVRGMIPIPTEPNLTNKHGVFDIEFEYPMPARTINLSFKDKGENNDGVNYAEVVTSIAFSGEHMVRVSGDVATFVYDLGRVTIVSQYY